MFRVSKCLALTRRVRENVRRAARPVAQRMVGAHCYTSFTKHQRRLEFKKRPPRLC